MDNRNFVGWIVLNNTVDITDPCYDKSVWCRINDVPIEPGTYACFEHVTSDGRTSACEILIGVRSNEDFEIFQEEGEFVGAIGVDAGLAGFFADKRNKFFDIVGYDELEKYYHVGENGYILPMGESNTAVDDNAFFTSSGYGDGEYEVYGVANSDGNYYWLCIRFC
jgi:hypothetical protein